ncbi:bifunctional precorrin-2 dehydrogenase/sirohydrochlorin ferrochelatase [Imperialibacter roseus]|uniref:precorrin-2 dehydrogenase n=1 Tax=Imperialibacter roseus TaxID=1324217 RepID=A0ABZ0IPL3_9BACT|nr:bifunctional precorrin-2 dehydrogenase/sirohydrochlorin ferrochelatase [Imperialibacter roseus]WOK05661.1 bifunctional precorrin-2 dehydrogenase/sirohydrochlorin ferrochelatase [Imperialibacter roseus]
MSQNTLFPVFLKLENFNTLLVGGGNVGLEKLTALLVNNPLANVMVVADRYLEETEKLAKSSPNVVLTYRKFEFDDLNNKQLVILATDNFELHKEIKLKTTELGILTNVADTPALCDFYLGSIVRKGDLKIAISTNGKSPTLAKRMRQYLEEAIPDSMQSLLDNMKTFRDKLKGDFSTKLEVLNDLTSSMIEKEKKDN